MTLILERSGGSPAAAPARGFELVEDDDVVFTLGVCREVNRIYQDYQDGALEADRALLSGMYVTLETLAGLEAKVTAGMPAMRVQVATAQAKEILAVLYGQAAVLSLDPGTLTRLVRRHRAVVTASVRGTEVEDVHPAVAALPPAPAPAPEESVPGDGMLLADPEVPFPEARPGRITRMKHWWRSRHRQATESAEVGPSPEGL